jgi:hypothetical protein
LIEVKLCHDKRRELNVYENLFVDFIDTEYWLHWYEGSSSTINEWNWPFTKLSKSIW